VLLIFPLLCFAALVYGFRRSGVGGDPRRAFLSAAVAWGAIATALVEVLSLFEWLTAGSLASCWAGAAVVAALFGFRQGGWGKPPGRPSSLRPTSSLLGLYGGIGVVVVVTGLTALAGFPNDGDSLWYHLGRVAHWEQNRSVAFYPTSILPQLYYPPWSGYAILQLSLLGWDERLVNLVQCFSMVGSVVGVSAVARQLGADARGQVFSAFFCALLPMGILQASTTQNDYVTSFWLVCLVHALLDLTGGAGSTGPALRAGVALGLALLTKATAYVFAAPVAAVLLLTLGPRRSWARVQQVMVVGLLALLLNTPHYVRNYELFGLPLGPLEDAQAAPVGQLNEAFSADILVSNVVRGGAIHVGTPFPDVNAAAELAVTRSLARLGIDANDPRSTWRQAAFPFTVPRAPGDEATAGNPIQLVLIVASCCGIVAWRGRSWDPRAKAYGLSLVLAFLLLSLLFKWRPFLSHWQLPLFVLWSPLVGRFFQEHRRPFMVAALAMACWALPFLLLSRGHPLIGVNSVLFGERLDQSFRHSERNKAMFAGAAEVVRSVGCSEVGLLTPWFGLEYAVWVTLPEIRAAAGRLEHVGVSNVSARLESRRPEFWPCAVIALFPPPSQVLDLGGRTFSHAWSDGDVAVFLEEGQP
jgi:hypothetical protein